MIIVPNDSSDTDKGVANSKPGTPPSPVFPVCLALDICFGTSLFWLLNVYSMIHRPRMMLQGDCHLNWLSIVSAPFLISNLPILSAWVAQMRVSKDRGWSTLLLSSLRLSCPHYDLPKEIDETYFLIRRTERSTRMSFCCRPVIRIKIRQSTFIYIHNPSMGVWRRDW